MHFHGDPPVTRILRMSWGKTRENAIILLAETMFNPNLWKRGCSRKRHTLPAFWETVVAIACTVPNMQ
jgi:hypothetical protein